MRPEGKSVPARSETMTRHHGPTRNSGVQKRWPPWSDPLSRRVSHAWCEIPHWGDYLQKLGAFRRIALTPSLSPEVLARERGWGEGRSAPTGSRTVFHRKRERPRTPEADNEVSRLRSRHDGVSPPDQLLCTPLQRMPSVPRMPTLAGRGGCLGRTCYQGTKGAGARLSRDPSPAGSG